MSEKIVKLGLVGFGTVGGSVCKMLAERADLLRKRSGVEFQVVKVALRDLKKKREVELSPEILTQDWKEVVEHPEVDIVVELMGGTTIAYDVVEAALRAGRPVVTGNKALLAERGAEVFSLSSETGVPVYFEAAVAGGIPIIKTLREAFISNSLVNFAGIINGTCNYILERMTEAGLSYEVALKEAMELGYAEADPTLDVNGWDQGHKAILLGAVSYGFLPSHEEVHVSGIENVKLEDITLADQLGYTLKLLSVVKPTAEGLVEIRTQPSLVPKSHLLAQVNGVFNAASLSGDEVGDAFLCGRGAGGGPTATAVVADLVDAASTLGTSHRAFLPYDEKGFTLAKIEDTETAYFIRLEVKDEAGVMAKITSLCGDHGISFSGTHSQVDPASPDAEMNQVSFLTHTAPYGKLIEAVSALEALDCVTTAPTVYRVELFS